MKSKFTDEQFAFAPKPAELGTSVEEVCRKMGIREATFYVWRRKYAGIGTRSCGGCASSRRRAASSSRSWPT